MDRNVVTFIGKNFNTKKIDANSKKMYFEKNTIDENKFGYVYNYEYYIY